MIYIDYRDRRPIYEQVISKIEELVRLGALSPDEKLPSVRALATEVSINPNTIQKAYQELERRGVIYTVKGKGNFVSTETLNIRKARIDEIYAEIKVYSTELVSLGESVADIKKNITSTLDTLGEGKK